MLLFKLTYVSCEIETITGFRYSRMHYDKANHKGLIDISVSEVSIGVPKPVLEDVYHVHVYVSCVYGVCLLGQT